MTRYWGAFTLAIVGVSLAVWLTTWHKIGAGGSFVAVLASIVIAATVQRVRFGRETGWRAKFDPVVLGAAIVSYLLISIAVPVVRP